MAIPMEVLDHIAYLDRSFGAWEHLPDTHPDIIKLRQLSVLIDDRKKNSRLWGKDRDDYLKAVWSFMYDAEIATVLHVSESSVYSRRVALGLIRPKRQSRARPIYQTDIRGNRLRRFETIKSAAQFMNCSPNAIRDVCVGVKKGYKGFGWEYE